MYLLSHRKHKYEMEEIYWKQYDLDIYSIDGGFDWYSLVSEDRIIAECSVVLNACGYFQINDVDVVQETKKQDYCQKMLKMVIDDLSLTKGTNGVTIQTGINTPQDSCCFNVFSKYENFMFHTEENNNVYTITFD